MQDHVNRASLNGVAERPWRLKFRVSSTCGRGNQVDFWVQIAALKNLKLNIRRAKIKAGAGANKFYITDALTSEKILKSARLEEIRLTIFNNLLKYHPESGSAIGWGESATPVTEADPLHPLGARDG